jgi:hypothetical protein
MTFEPTSIDLFGIRIDEPVTTITDLIISAVCYYAFYMLHSRRPNYRLNIYMKYYFLSMGIATTIGGLIGHGFLYLFSFSWKLPGWVTSMFSIALLERASIEYCRPQIHNKSIFRLFAWVNIIELVTFLIITLYTLDFFFVEVHSAYGLLIVVTGFQAYIYYQTKSKASRLALIAVGFSALAATTFQLQIGLHKWFNHFDVSHIFMTIAAWIFYLSAMEMTKKVNVIEHQHA